MPSPQRVAWAQLRVGILAAASMFILGVLIFLLTGTKKLWVKEADLYTYLDDSAALAKGAPVRLNGILIGSVADIGLSGDTRPRRIIRVRMEIEREMFKNIPVDSIAAISAENVLGTKFINITRGQSATTVQPGAEIASLDTREFSEVVQQGYALLTSLQGILKRVDAIVGLVEAGKGSIGRLLVDEELYNRLLAIVAEGNKLAAALNSPRGTIGRLIYDDQLYEDLRTSLGRVDRMLVELNEGRGTAGRLLKDEALYNEARSTIAELRKTIEDLNAGKGTAGKLLKSEELHDQLRTSLAKVDLLLDKINSGQGTIGQLLVNQQLYDSINGLMQEAQSLVKDIRADPRKYLRIKLALF
jgi:phospholipid/cholesterol/gamma-HCH transport system substrate-binding protein